MPVPRKLYLALFYVFTRTTPRFWQLFQNHVVSYFIALFWGSYRRILLKNIAIILGRPERDPAVRQAARRVFRNYGLYLVDYVQMNRARTFLVPEERGTQHIQQALDEGRGAILVTPHLGNWELGAVTFASRSHVLYALTLKDDEGRVQDFRDGARGTLGVETIHMAGENYATVLKIVNLLKDNQVVAMLGDRWEEGRKVAVSFFGKRVWFPAGAPALALASGAPIIPAYTVARKGGTYLAWMDPPIRVARTGGMPTAALIAAKTQEIATAFENVIRHYPDQWYHFFDYWERYGCTDTAA